ncbi:hypothetical protein JCM8097_002758 [Rhodosporidiobolus ruineniae]
MASTRSTGIVESVTNTISDAVNYATETVQELSSSSSKEANKEVAKGNTNASLTDRATAGLDAVGDKLQEEKHSAKADAYKESAKN